MQGKRRTFQSLTPSFINVVYSTRQKACDCFNIAGAQLFVLIGQDYEVYEVKFTDVTPSTTFSKLPLKKHPNTS